MGGLAETKAGLSCALRGESLRENELVVVVLVLELAELGGALPRGLRYPDCPEAI